MGAYKWTEGHTNGNGIMVLNFFAMAKKFNTQKVHNKGQSFVVQSFVVYNSLALAFSHHLPATVSYL